VNFSYVHNLLNGKELGRISAKRMKRAGYCFWFGWCSILSGRTGGAGATQVRKWRRYGRGSGDWRASEGFGGAFEAARVNRTALAGCGKAVLRGGYYAIGGVQLGFFG